MSQGTCACGCGGVTQIAKKTRKDRGYVRGQPVSFLKGHHLIGKKYAVGDSFIDATGYVRVRMPSHPHADRSGYVHGHVMVAAWALGRPLPPGAEVHHANGDKIDNRPSNLVICQDHAYHMLLHRRMRALEECGHADWRKCWVCGQYDHPDRLYVNESQAYHSACIRDRYKSRYQRSTGRRKRLDYAEIKRLKTSGVSAREIAARLGCSQGGVVEAWKRIRAAESTD